MKIVPPPSRDDGRDGTIRRTRVAIALLILLVGAALSLRLQGLGDRVFCHPENFTPGIEVPAWLDSPPERTSLVDVLRGTVFYDGHPPGFFVAMLAWVKAFGTSLVSLRLPSALLGAASVALLFLIGRRERSVRAGLIAALLLTLHGFHLYWSQKSRMYVPLAFVGMLSTLLLYRCVESGRLRTHVAYVLTIVAGLWTQIYAWPLLAAQIAWTAMGALGGERRAAVLRLQALALVAGAPTIQLAIFQNPKTRWNEPVSGFFELGFLFHPGLPFWGERPWAPGSAALLLLGVLLLAAGLFALLRRPKESRVGAPTSGWETRGRAFDWCFAAAVTGVLLLFARRWLGGGGAVTAAAAFPYAALAGHRLLEAVLDRAQRRELVPEKLLAPMRALPQSLLLALLPVGLMAGLSAFRGAFTARGTLLFLPYLLLVVSFGIDQALRNRRRLVQVGASAVLGLLLLTFAASARYVGEAEFSKRDYAGVAAALERTRPHDLILVRNTWIFAPLYYYLDRSFDAQLVHRSEPAAIAAAPAGVDLWMVRFDSEGLRKEMDEALASWHIRERIRVPGGEVRRFTRDPEGPGQPPLRTDE